MADYWHSTAQMFSYLFEKPKMSQKLLEKPPFKYIFDIIMETTKQTGYAKGLYTGDELDGKYYQTKDRKMYFLQKIIDLTSITLNEEIQAQPKKIVAGQEPEKTNLFLQAIYRAAKNYNTNVNHVEQFLAANGAGPIVQEKEQFHIQLSLQGNLNSVQQNEMEQIIYKQQVQIQQLEYELQNKVNIILNYEQQIEILKKQQEQNTQ